MEATESPPERSAAPPLDDLRRSALSTDATVRKQTADQVRARMEEDFETVFDATQEWALDGDERLREVAALACRHTPQVTDEVRARRLIGRLELFLGDRSPRVATIAATDVLPHLLELQPSIVPGWVRTWTQNTEEPVRVDLARVLGAIAERYPTEAVEGLSEITIDPRPRVRTAVLDTLDALAERNPTMGSYLRARFASLYESP